ncbi:MAG: isopeptide-forming domain-containing fimbrial protein [Leptolyngbyaceae cyanobacterium bins.302]|nr:isopeptide-forming domain-containing fimbrial protein [Leptolyngbyaceae cyanobacterium bins.302]
MSSPTPLGLKRLRRAVFAVVAGGLSLHGLAVYAQTIIPNTATANFRSTPGGPFRNVRSNTVTVPLVAERLEIIKVGDRGAAEPGDTVIYRLLVKNSGSSTLTNLVVTDTLPLGLQYVNNSAKASLSTAGSPDVPVNISAGANGQIVTFTYPSLAPQQTLTIVYAALLTPDAVRGSGRNSAVARARNPAGGEVVSNSSTHLLRIRPGILSDCGTILGRVFVDKNFDGEQQPGEPGVPNAVVFMDDGNRITTDAEGLFSLPYAIAGQRTGTLDLTSLPGYTLAPNLYRIENNAPSRLVRLAPGGMARMNFAVTPSFREGRQ